MGKHVNSAVLSTRVDRDIAAAVRREASMRDMAVNELLRLIITRWLALD